MRLSFNVLKIQIWFLRIQDNRTKQTLRHRATAVQTISRFWFGVCLWHMTQFIVILVVICYRPWSRYRLRQTDVSIQQMPPPCCAGAAAIINQSALITWSWLTIIKLKELRTLPALGQFRSFSAETICSFGRNLWSSLQCIALKPSRNWVDCQFRYLNRNRSTSILKLVLVLMSMWTQPNSYIHCESEPSNHRDAL